MSAQPHVFGKQAGRLTSWRGLCIGIRRHGSGNHTYQAFRTPEVSGQPIVVIVGLQGSEKGYSRLLAQGFSESTAILVESAFHLEGALTRSNVLGPWSFTHIRNKVQSTSRSMAVLWRLCSLLNQGAKLSIPARNEVGTRFLARKHP